MGRVRAAMRASARGRCFGRLHWAIARGRISREGKYLCAHIWIELAFQSLDMYT
jgi:hypothetical protein